MNERGPGKKDREQTEVQVIIRHLVNDSGSAAGVDLRQAIQV